jgi:hypothetical protein
METEAVTALVGSAIEVAVIWTLPPAGTVAGATYVVATPLSVSTGPKKPQSVDPQSTDHRTPSFVTSLFNTALNWSLAPTCNVDGGAGANTTEIGCPWIVRVTVATRLGSAVAEA